MPKLRKTTDQKLELALAMLALKSMPVAKIAELANCTPQYLYQVLEKRKKEAQKNK